MTINTNPRLLFIVPPGDIHEHPPDLPTDPEQIPTGHELFKDWLVFAPDFGGHRGEFIGPVPPVVTRPYGELSRELCIQVNGSDFWFGVRPAHCCDAPTNRPCWYQSGTTLRFVRRRKTVEEREAEKPATPTEF